VKLTDIGNEGHVAVEAVERASSGVVAKDRGEVVEVGGCRSGRGAKCCKGDAPPAEGARRELDACSDLT
jgi:hypothetical protein